MMSEETRKLFEKFLDDLDQTDATAQDLMYISAELTTVAISELARFQAESALHREGLLS